MSTEMIPGMQGFDEYVVAMMQETKTPGLGLAIVRDGKVLVATGYGMRDVEKGLPVTGDTLFAIGSASKAFATACLGMLADEGKFDWDRPLREYVPGFRMHDPVASERVTARDICCHRTGLPRHTFFVMDSRATRQEMVDGLRFLEPNKDFRTTWQYQNHMFGLAGHLVEVVSGKTWEEMARTRIFGPLGMAGSCFSPRVAETRTDWAEPYAEKDGALVKIPARELFAEAPAGGIYSSPREMANWVRLHLADGEFEGQRLVSDAQMIQMHSRQMLIPDTAETAILQKWGDIGPGAYGLGWFRDTYRGHDVVHHGGGIDGFSTMVTMMPKEKIGIVMIVNRGSLLPAVLPYNIYDRLLGLSLTDWVGRAKEVMGQMESQQKDAKAAAEARRIKGTQPSHPLDDYVGQYQHPGYGVLTVTRQGETLTAQHHDVSCTLKHWHYDVFEFEYPSFGITFKLAFHADYDGAIATVSIPFEPSVKDIVYTRAAGAAMSDPAFLGQFVGDYEVAGMSIAVRLRAGVLIVQAPGQGDQELAPSRGDAFKFKAMPVVSVEFKRDSQGRVVEAMLNQPNGSLVARRKA